MRVVGMILKRFKPNSSGQVVLYQGAADYSDGTRIAQGRVRVHMEPWGDNRVQVSECSGNPAVVGMIETHGAQIDLTIPDLHDMPLNSPETIPSDDVYVQHGVNWINSGDCGDVDTLVFHVTSQQK